MSLLNHAPQRSHNYDTLTTRSVVNSLVLAGALCGGIWALIAVTILGT